MKKHYLLAALGLFLTGCQNVQVSGTINSGNDSVSDLVIRIYHVLSLELQYKDFSFSSRFFTVEIDGADEELKYRQIDEKDVGEYLGKMSVTTTYLEHDQEIKELDVYKTNDISTLAVKYSDSHFYPVRLGKPTDSTLAQTIFKLTDFDMGKSIEDKTLSSSINDVKLDDKVISLDDYEDLFTSIIDSNNTVDEIEDKTEDEYKPTSNYTNGKMINAIYFQLHFNIIGKGCFDGQIEIRDDLTALSFRYSFYKLGTTFDNIITKYRLK